MFSKTIEKVIYSNPRNLLGFIIGSSVIGGLVSYYSNYKAKTNLLFNSYLERKTLENGFVEFPVTAGKQNTSIIPHIFELFSNLFQPSLKGDEINFQLPKKVAPENLPYADFLTREKLNAMNTQRSNDYRLFWRGENRRSEEIIEAGGFHPNCLKPGNETLMRSPDEIFNVNIHSESSAGSGLVSFTASKDVAKSFGQLYSKDNYYVYLVKTVGALSPASTASAQLESEYNVPGGVNSEAIVSYRQYNMQSVTHHSIFVSRKFISENPEQVERVLKENLENDEVINTANNRL